MGFIKDLWNDFTGVTQVEKQNQANQELAKYQAQVNEDFYNKYSSPSAIMDQLEKAGLNRNLAYSAATGGQSNVPSYSAPQVERQMSGSQKFERALSMLSGLLGFKQNMYQTDAAREQAEQAAIKTRSDYQQLLKQSWDNKIYGLTRGLTDAGWFRRWKDRRARKPGSVDAALGSSDDLFSQYMDAYRGAEFNKLLQPGFENGFNYGAWWKNMDEGLQKSPVPSYMYYRNKQMEFNYNWDQEFKTYLKSAGALAPYLSILAKMFSGK